MIIIPSELKIKKAHGGESEGGQRVGLALSLWGEFKKGLQDRRRWLVSDNREAGFQGGSYKRQGDDKSHCSRRCRARSGGSVRISSLCRFCEGLFWYF